VSFDWRKVAKVKQVNPQLTVGTLFTTWYADVFQRPTQMLTKWFPKYKQCWKDAPSDSVNWFKFALQTGIVFKLSGSSSFDSNLDLYSDHRYSNNTVEMLRRNYGQNVSSGFYTMYSMGDSEEQHIEAEYKLLRLMEAGGAERVITDNVPRAKRFLRKRNAMKKKDKPLCSSGSIATSNILLFVALLCFLFAQ